MKRIYKYQLLCFFLLTFLNLRSGDQSRVKWFQAISKPLLDLLKIGVDLKQNEKHQAETLRQQAQKMEYENIIANQPHLSEKEKRRLAELMIDRSEARLFKLDLESSTQTFSSDPDINTFITYISQTNLASNSHLYPFLEKLYGKDEAKREYVRVTQTEVTHMANKITEINKQKVYNLKELNSLNQNNIQELIQALRQYIRHADKVTNLLKAHNIPSEHQDFKNISSLVNQIKTDSFYAEKHLDLQLKILSNKKPSRFEMTAIKYHLLSGPDASKNREFIVYPIIIFGGLITKYFVIPAIKAYWK